MSIARRSSLLLALPLLALAGITALWWCELRSVQQANAVVADRLAPGLANLGRFAGDLIQLGQQLNVCLTTADDASGQEARREFDVRLARAEDLLRQHQREFVADDWGRRLVDHLHAVFAEWSARARLAAAPVEEGEVAEERRQRSARLQATQAPLRQALDDLLGHEENLLLSTQRTAVEASESARRHLLWGTAVAVFVVLSGSWRLLAGLTSPLRQISSAAHAAAFGQQRDAVPTPSPTDELVGLAQSLAVLEKAAAELETRRRVKDRAARLLATLQRAESERDFAHQLLLGCAVPTSVRASLYRHQANPAGWILLASVGEATTRGPDWIPSGHDPVPLSALRREPASDPPTADPSLPQRSAWPLLLVGHVPAVLEVVSKEPVEAEARWLLEEILPVAALILNRLPRGA